MAPTHGVTLANLLPTDERLNDSNPRKRNFKRFSCNSVNERIFERRIQIAPYARFNDSRVNLLNCNVRLVNATTPPPQPCGINRANSYQISGCALQIKFKLQK